MSEPTLTVNMKKYGLEQLSTKYDYHEKTSFKMDILFGSYAYSI